MKGILYGFGRDIKKYGRCIGIGIGNGNIILFGIDNGGICCRNCKLFWKLRMSCSYIGMGLVKYYMRLINIVDGHGNGNVIWFCNYNRNHHSGSRSIGIRIRIGNIIGFRFSFWY